MKKIALVLLSLFVFSCVQEDIVQDTIAKDDSILNSKISNLASSRVTPSYSQEEITNARLKIYAYAIGRIFKDDYEQANNELQFYYNMTDSDSIPIKYFLDLGWFYTRIMEQFNLMQVSSFGYQNNPLARVDPAVPPIMEEVPLFRSTTENEITILGYRSFGESTGMELFIARDFVANSAINITAHPLDNSNSSSGYIFDNPTNSTATFDNAFLASHPNNVLVVRPHRDATHPYDYIDVADFTTYYSN